MIRTDAAAGQFQRNVGNYARGTRLLLGSLRSLAGAFGFTSGIYLFAAAVSNAFRRVREFDKSKVVLYLLSINQDIQDKVFEEIKDFDEESNVDLQALREYSYLDQVISEVMRLYPPVWTFGRRAIEDDEIMGYQIPAGTTVTVPCLCLQL